tara:strand:+ start:111 stop:707 length:597 start_codon:yes stop_codon:yes gene_type:complete
MNKKTLLQLLLLSVVFFIVIVFFFTYFYERPEKNKLIENKKKIDDQSLVENGNTSNIIKNIKYLSFDNMGNQYEINAETGEIRNNNSEIIYMKNVKAKINFVNSETISIAANLATYNTKNYNTNFLKNINMNYMENKIECQKLDLLFDKNLALLYDNIIFTNLKTKLLADRLEIDLTTKNFKISMNNQDTKIKMLYNK